jgi:pimeloyl-ACP methyl ester carboxylesterase
MQKGVCCFPHDRSVYLCMTIIFLLVLFALIFLLFFSMLIFVIGPFMLMQPYRRTGEYYRKHTPLLHPSDLSVEYEELTLNTSEGIPLRCWFLKAPARSRGTIIYLHGVSECKIAGLPVAQMLLAKGFNVFLYDSRRHGESGGMFCTYGFYEKHDTSGIISYLLSRSDIAIGKIGLFGNSMGAAVAIQVAANDKRVAAVVAESGFSTLRTVFDDYQKRMIKLPWHYLRNIVIKRSEYLAHFKANAVSPLAAVQRVHVPLFVLHGTVDELIKPVYSEAVWAQANDPKELWLLPGARHSDMVEVGGDEYRRRVMGFLEEHLG